MWGTFTVDSPCAALRMLHPYSVCAALLAVVEMIAQESKFCKPLLLDFVKLQQSDVGPIAPVMPKTVQSVQIWEEILCKMKSRFGRLNFYMQI